MRQGRNGNGFVRVCTAGNRLTRREGRSRGMLSAPRPNREFWALAALGPHVGRLQLHMPVTRDASQALWFVDSHVWCVCRRGERRAVHSDSEPTHVELREDFCALTNKACFTSAQTVAGLTERRTKAAFAKTVRPGGEAGRQSIGNGSAHVVEGHFAHMPEEGRQRVHFGKARMP